MGDLPYSAYCFKLYSLKLPMSAKFAKSAWSVCHVLNIVLRMCQTAFSHDLCGTKCPLLCLFLCTINLTFSVQLSRFAFDPGVTLNLVQWQILIPKLLNLKFITGSATGSYRLRTLVSVVFRNAYGTNNRMSVWNKLFDSVVVRRLWNECAHTSSFKW